MLSQAPGFIQFSEGFLCFVLAEAGNAEIVMDHGVPGPDGRGLSQVLFRRVIVLLLNIHDTKP